MKHRLFLLVMMIITAGCGIIHAQQTEIRKNKAVDFSKIRYWVGEGSNQAAFIFQYKNNQEVTKFRPQNLVFGIKWNDKAPTPAEVFDMICARDSRFIMVERNSEGKLNRIGYDCDCDGTISRAKDIRVPDLASKSNDWIFLLSKDNCNYTEVTDENAATPIDNGNVIALSYIWNATGQENKSVTLDFLLYRPDDSDKQEIVVPEEWDHWLTTYTQLCLPMFYNRQYKDDQCQNFQQSNTKKWSVSGSEGLTEKFYANTGYLTVSAATGEIDIKGYQKVIHKESNPDNTQADWAESNVCKLRVHAPEIPVKSISFETSEITVPLKSSYYSVKFKVEPENATYQYFTFTSDNKASVTARSNDSGSNFSISTTTTPGTAVITAVCGYDPSISTTLTVHNQPQKLVTDIIVPSDDIVLDYKAIMQFIPTVEPTDADITDLTFTIDNDIVGYYKNTHDLIAYKAGEGILTISSQDGGGVSRKVKIKVNAPVEYSGGYDDGMFILNEEWFGHRNGSINYFTEKHTPVYRAYDTNNNGVAFGATACYGMIFGNKLFINSKQAYDNGDIVKSGRLVVADAQTMKNIVSFPDLPFGGDARCCVGVSASKAYIASTNGIGVFDIDNLTFTSKIEGISNKQLGDMICVGSYVLVIQESVGTIVIDAETDQVVKLIPDTDIQGITQSCDGHIWLATQTELQCLDPESLEVINKVQLPENNRIKCTWLAWRPTPFFASPTENVLYWIDNTSWTTAKSYYRWEIGSEMPANLQPLLTLTSEIGATAYGTPRIDGRNNEMIVMSVTGSAGFTARYNWVNYVDATTGKIKDSVKLDDYYWFQAMPIFPDKYAPEISLNDISVARGETITIDLAKYLHDQDANDMDVNIRPALVYSGTSSIAETSIDRKKRTLTLKGVANGTSIITLNAESRGITTTKDITVTVGNTTSINAIGTDGRSATKVSTEGDEIIIAGLQVGQQISVYTIDGRTLTTLISPTDSVRIKAAHGIYIVKVNQFISKVTI